MIGQTISHYTILEKLGEGGMGVVYKAQDTKLDRFVALKFLPSHVSTNAETKARFLQEAKAAAALNQNNICTIYGVDESNGTMFIAMEFIEGGTLREKIPFTKLDDALTVAAQIGDALQEAHSKGIVHRDIKADNIMLTSKGQAKVMDFGLAKLKGSLKLTRTSSTVGTLGYMAPEQIQGGEVDHRSDIFSFGVLFFEMLTGKLPFRGEHEAAMVYSIVNEEPMQLDQLRPEASSLLSNLILRCLEKDPADRFQHMDDIVSELRRAQKKTSKVVRSSAYTPVQHAAEETMSGDIPQPAVAQALPVRKNPLMRYGIAGGVIVILAAAAWLLLPHSRPKVNPDMTTRVLQVPFTQYSYPGISPDGNWVAFPAADVNGKWDIYYMHVNGGEPRKITSDATTFIQQAADISFDGSQIVYTRPSDDTKTNDVFAISALGGTSRKLATGGDTPLWRPDGKRVGFIRTPNSDTRSESGMVEFWSVNADGSDARREYRDSLFVVKGGDYRYSFCWSPNGNSIAWIRSHSGSSQVIIIHDLQTGGERQLTAGKENIDSIVWTVDDQIIFSSNRAGNTNLWTVPASGGEALQVTKGGGPDIGMSVSRSGKTLMYLQQQPVGYLWTANLDGSSLRQITFDDREIWEPTVSPDKKQIAFVMRDPDPLKNNTDLYVVDHDGSNRRRLTTGNTVSRVPSFSPNGQKIMYSVPPTNQGADTSTFSIYVVDVDHPGPPKLVGSNFGVDWFDDNHILIVDNVRVRSSIASLSGGPTRRFFSDSVFVWSVWDNRHLVYYDRHSDKRGWWVVETEKFDATELLKQTGDIVTPILRGPARKIGAPPGPFSNYTSRSSSSGFMLQYAGQGKIRKIWFTGRTEEALPAAFAGVTNRSINITLDGNEIVYVTPRLSARLILVENLFK
ncbi:MAG: protein kinase [Ignavibacteriales bacterium]|nr:protein kinase [Ignavibacteriales bacterium]